MKKRIKKSSGTHESEFNQFYTKNSVFISIVVIILGVASLFYIGFFSGTVECGDVACYQEYLLSCKQSYLFNEDDNYVYRYEILGANTVSYCNVDVRLIKVKGGSDDSQSLEGLNMECMINRFEDVLPEKDMLACDGKLRQELQEIIIDRMHNQILRNIKQVNAELAG